MMRNIGYTALILAGIAVFAFAQDATTFTTLAVTSTSTFTGAITATGGVVGDVTGDLTGDVTGAVVQEVALKGNLPAITGTNGMDGRLYKNTAGDSLWMATDADSSWTQIAP